MKTKKNKLTVGIPFYKKTNVEYFDIAIKSIINQTVAADNIYLIQDGSVGPELSKLINKYIKKYNFIQLLPLPKNGLPHALNQSIKKSNTEFYARMDADDISIKSRFEEQLSYLKDNPKVEILGSWAYEFESDHLNESLYLNKTPKDKKTIENYFHYRNPLIHPSIVFRKKVFNKIGFYNENYFTDQDLELWSRALRDNIKIYNLQKPLIYLRTENRLKRRSQLSAIKRQIRIRYSYNTCSFKFNFLKLAAILLRLLPISVSDWCYKNLRNL